MKDNIIRDKSFQFPINSIDLYKAMIEEKEFILSKQFLRSATSIGANIEKVTAGVSKKTLSINWQLLLKRQEKLIIG